MVILEFPFQSSLLHFLRDNFSIAGVKFLQLLIGRILCVAVQFLVNQNIPKTAELHNFLLFFVQYNFIIFNCADKA